LKTYGFPLVGTLKDKVGFGDWGEKNPVQKRGDPKSRNRYTKG